MVYLRLWLSLRNVISYTCPMSLDNPLARRDPHDRDHDVVADQNSLVRFSR